MSTRRIIPLSEVTAGASAVVDIPAEALPRYETRQRVTTPAEDIAAAVEAVIRGGPRPAAVHSVGEWIPTAGGEA